MTSLSCFVGRLPALSKASGSKFISGRYKPTLRPLIQKMTSRGVKTVTPAAPSEEISVEEEEDISSVEERTQKVRDISRLRPDHRNKVNMVPSEENNLPMHFTARYQKRTFGRYGYASGVNPSLCWPSKEELKDKKEYEDIAYPYSILEVAEREAAKEAEEELQIFKRDAQVAANVKTMMKMKEEFLKRQEKQKADAQAAKAFKTRLLEEVRLHFNYTVNERDEQFRLELKERAKQLRDKEKLEKKSLKKEKQAVEKAAKFEEQKRKLKEEEERKSASKTKAAVN